MIIGKIHPGSGLGDQLFSYITTRTIALDHNYDFGFVGKEFFKGKDFMNLDWGANSGLEIDIQYPAGKVVTRDNLPLWEAPAYYDPEVNFIEDGTVIDATCAQDERYWDIDKVREWLKVEPLEMPDDLCVINFRGGEFATVPELFLPREYWYESGNELQKQYYNKLIMEVHTDDIGKAQEYFGHYPIKDYIKDIELNWRSIRYAKHLILSNSAFGILPSLLNENVKEVIAPRYWARRNIKQWSMPSNYYRKFTYI